MVERFGYSLDVGKSMDNEGSSEETKESEKPESEDKKQAPEIEEEDLKEVSGEDLSAKNMQKDILDEIKEDIEVKPVSFDKVEENDDDEDEPDLTRASDEAYKDETKEEQDEIAPIIDDSDEDSAEEKVKAGKESAQDEEVVDKKEEGVPDKREELDEFEEPMPDKPEPEPEPEPEKPPGPEEKDVNDMVDRSFKETNSSPEDEAKEGVRFGRKYKWIAGIAIIIVLALLVYKLGFVGVVDNNPEPVVSDEGIDQELDEFFQDSEVVSDIETGEASLDLPETSEPVPVKKSEESPLKDTVEPSLDDTPSLTDEQEKQELLDVLKQGLE